MRLSLPLNLAAGIWGESRAEALLRQKGYKILSRRFRVTVRDEFDLVARDGDTLVFVEVKTRRRETHGRPIESVDRRKRHVLSRAAVRYLKRLDNPVNFRFDVVEVVGTEGGVDPVVRHVENAFSLDRCYVLPW